MEKVWNSDDLLPKKFKSIMKITLLFLILGILHVSADTYAQKAQVTVEVKSGTFLTVSQEDFIGGIRAVIRGRNILIDHSFRTALRNEYDQFIFSGGDDIE